MLICIPDLTCFWIIPYFPLMWCLLQKMKNWKSSANKLVWHIIAPLGLLDTQLPGAWGFCVCMRMGRGSEGRGGGLLRSAFVKLADITFVQPWPARSCCYVSSSFLQFEHVCLWPWQHSLLVSREVWTAIGFSSPHSFLCIQHLCRCAVGCVLGDGIHVAYGHNRVYSYWSIISHLQWVEMIFWRNRSEGTISAGFIGFIHSYTVSVQCSLQTECVE